MLTAMAPSSLAAQATDVKPTKIANPVFTIALSIRDPPRRPVPLMNKSPACPYNCVSAPLTLLGPAWNVLHPSLTDSEESVTTGSARSREHRRKPHSAPALLPPASPRWACRRLAGRFEWGESSRACRRSSGNECPGVSTGDQLIEPPAEDNRKGP